MKKITLLTALTIFSVLLISCQSTKTTTEVSADSYVTEDSEDSSTKTTKKTTVKTDKSKNAFLNFFKGKEKYAYGQEFTLFTRNILNKLHQTDAVMTIKLKDGKAGFGSIYTASYAYVFFDEKARKSLSNAYSYYLSDFENKRLSRKTSKTIRQYGKITVDLNWGTLKASTPNYGTGEAYLGYQFINNSPYFSLYIPEMFNEYSKNTESSVKSSWTEKNGTVVENAQIGSANSVNRTSTVLTYNFTKAQMANLLEVLSEENISAMWNEINNPYDLSVDENVDFDDYESEENATSTEEIITVSDE